MPAAEPQELGRESASDRLTRSLLRVLPRNHVSSISGTVAKMPLPRWIRSKVFQAYAARYGAKLQEAELPITEYRSLADFFTRNLKPGLRPVGQGVVSPVDGTISESGPLDRDRMIQAKGLDYTISELLYGKGPGRIEGESELSRSFSGGRFVTFYLAPGDYHQIHSPVSGCIEATIIHPGTLWPVNNWSVRTVPSLFAINERVVTVIATPAGRVAVVMVGATNVGSITLRYAPFRTNVGIWMGGERKSRLVRHAGGSGALPQGVGDIEKGDALGTFNLGSTVVLLFEPGVLEPNERLTRGPIRYGESIGKLHSAGPR